MWLHAESETGMDRRTSSRIVVELLVRFRSEMNDIDVQADFVEGEVVDVSDGGVFIRTTSLEPTGTPVRLLVSLPQSTQVLPLEGHVAWTAAHTPKGPGMGIRLSGPGLSASEIDRFLARYEADIEQA
jgi:uncharacterized protein (TIGR02266 family)